MDGVQIEAGGRECPPFPLQHHSAIQLEASQDLAIGQVQNGPPAVKKQPLLDIDIVKNPCFNSAANLHRRISTFLWQ